MKVVINTCYGGFSLSKKAVYWLAEEGCESAKKEIEEKNALVAKWGGDERGTGGEPSSDYFGKSSAYEWKNADNEGKRLMGYSWHPWDDLPRHDPLLARCVEALGEAADGGCASLKVVEIPDGTDYEIGEYDGMEHVAEKHRTWG